MDKPVCLESEVVWPFRNGIAMAVLLTMVLVAALDRGVPVRALTCAIALCLGALGIALGGCLPRMQRSGRNDESGDVVAILVFGAAYLGSGWVLFRWVFGDWDAAFAIAQTTAFGFMLGASVGVLLLTLVRGTTRELLTDLGILADGSRRRLEDRGARESPFSAIWLLVTCLWQVRVGRRVEADWPVNWGEEVGLQAANGTPCEDGRQANDCAVPESGGSRDADRCGRHLRASSQECPSLPGLDAASPGLHGPRRAGSAPIALDRPGNRRGRWRHD